MVATTLNVVGTLLATVRDVNPHTSSKGEKLKLVRELFLVANDVHLVGKFIKIGGFYQYEVALSHKVLVEVKALTHAFGWRNVVGNWYKALDLTWY